MQASRGGPITRCTLVSVKCISYEPRGERMRTGKACSCLARDVERVRDGETSKWASELLVVFMGLLVPGCAAHKPSTLVPSLPW
eukprot:661688-Pelagomonas_calceolata.AAC.1